jgi:phosphomannomutase
MTNPITAKGFHCPIEWTAFACNYPKCNCYQQTTENPPITSEYSQNRVEVKEQDDCIENIINFIQSRIDKNNEFIPVIEEYPLAKAVYTALNSEARSIMHYIQSLKK